nr:ROK family protein [Dehalococcoidales bacterium]
QSWPTQSESGPAAVLDRIAAAIQQTVEPEPMSAITGIGLGAPGPLDPWRGVIRSAPNLPGWIDVPLRDRIQERVGRPVFVGNDANLAALGELYFGAARGLKHVVYMTVSTGIGGGVIVDGRLLLGRSGLAGEVGHMTIEPNGPRCGCGNYGCLEALASGPAIARDAQARIANGARSKLTELVHGDLALLDAVAVEQAAREGDELAVDVLRRAGTYVGIGVTNLLHLFDPEMVVIGGGVSRAGDFLFRPVIETVKLRAMSSYSEGIAIVPAALGDNAGLMGAVALVLAQQA